MNHNISAAVNKKVKQQIMTSVYIFLTVSYLCCQLFCFFNKAMIRFTFFMIACFRCIIIATT